MLQQLAGLVDGNARIGRRHVHQIAFVERRHELRAEAADWPDANGKDQTSAGEHPPRVPQDELERRSIGGSQRLLDAILPRNAAANAIAHQHRHQRDGEDRRRGHRVGLGKRQRREQPSFLGFQSEHRQEAQSDDEQREEDRRPDLGGCVGQQSPTRFADHVGFALQAPVGVLDHDDGTIHHRPYGNGDAAERHDIGVDALNAHHHEGAEHRHRQTQDHHQRRTQVEKEQGAHKCHDRELLDQRIAEGVDGALYERGAIVDGDHLNARRQSPRQFRQPFLDAGDGGQRVFAATHDDDATHHLAFAVQIGDAAPHPRPGTQAGDVGQG